MTDNLDQKVHYRTVEDLVDLMEIDRAVRPAGRSSLRIETGTSADSSRAN
jgi:hypothetical protein